MEIEFVGRGGHASIQDNYEVSAMNLAQYFLTSLPEVINLATNQFSNNILGKPSLVPTFLQAGDGISPNKTAENAKMIIDIRTTPEMDKNFDDFMDNLANRFNFTWQYSAKLVPSSLVGEESVAVKSLLQVSGLDYNSITVSSGATDQGEFVSRLNAEVIIFGPGDFNQAHHQNEYLSRKKLNEFYEIILAWLKILN